MIKNIPKKSHIFFCLFLSLAILSPPTVLAAVTPTMIIEEARLAIEQARKAGADRVALDDYRAAQAWLAQAEKEYEARKSFLSRTRQLISPDKQKEEEIIYLATMAKIKGQTAEAKARRDTASARLNSTRKELADFRNAIEVMKQKLAEAEKAKEVQAKAEAERKALEEAKRKAAELEEQKKRELEEAKKRAAEIEALKQKELQAARLEEAQRLAQKERELAEAKIKVEQLAAQQAKEAAELKAREAKLAAERERMAALQKKAEALQKEKAILTEANKIPQVTPRSGEKEVILTILAINLFTPATELTPKGKDILDQVGTLLKKYPGYKVMVRGHTDSTGSEATNKMVSEKRAQKVREYLVAYQNVNPGQITAMGLGPAQPIATNDTEAGRNLNRRVEIALQTGE